MLRGMLYLYDICARKLKNLAEVEQICSPPTSSRALPVLPQLLVPFCPDAKEGNQIRYMDFLLLVASVASTAQAFYFQFQSCVLFEVISLPWTEFVEEVGPWVRSRDSAKIQALGDRL